MGSDIVLQKEEKNLLCEYRLLRRITTLEIQKKSEEEWILFVDQCFKHFHKFLRAKRNKAAICEIEDQLGAKHNSQTKVASAFENFFIEQLGTENSSNISQQIIADLPFNSLSDQQGENMTREVRDEEIRDVFMSIESNKSPGLDGWNAHFFKDFWHYVFVDICLAIKFVLSEGVIKRGLNPYTFASYPRFQTPQKLKIFVLSLVATLYTKV